MKSSITSASAKQGDRGPRAAGRTKASGTFLLRPSGALVRRMSQGQPYWVREAADAQP